MNYFLFTFIPWVMTSSFIDVSIREGSGCGVKTRIGRSQNYGQLGSYWSQGHISRTDENKYATYSIVWRSNERPLTALKFSTGQWGSKIFMFCVSSGTENILIFLWVIAGKAERLTNFRTFLKQFTKNMISRLIITKLIKQKWSVPLDNTTHIYKLILSSNRQKIKEIFRV